MTMENIRVCNNSVLVLIVSILPETVNRWTTLSVKRTRLSDEKSDEKLHSYCRDSDKRGTHVVLASG